METGEKKKERSAHKNSGESQGLFSPTGKHSLALWNSRGKKRKCSTADSCRRGRKETH